MSAFQPGDIILLDFPFSNRQGSKYRPGLVLAPSDFDGDYIVAYITSNADLALDFETAVQKTVEWYRAMLKSSFPRKTA